MFSTSSASDHSKQPVRIAAFTYNMGNSIGYGSNVPEEFMAKLNNNKPAVLIGCLQEAKHSVAKDQNLVERIGARLGYACLRSNEIDIATKRMLPWNLLWKSHTTLAVYYNADQINSDEIAYLGGGQVIDSSAPDNKGGIWFLLDVRGVVLGIIGVHLDSFSESKRNEQMQRLVDACYSSQSKVDAILTLGDFNLRLHKDVVNHDPANPHRKRTLTSIRTASDGVVREHKKLIEDSLKRWQQLSPSIRQFDFLRVNDYTYGFPSLFTLAAEPSYVPNAERDHTCDVGALDNIGVSQAGVAVLFPGEYDKEHDPVATVLFPKSYGLDTSDHAAVLGFWELYPAFKLVRTEEISSTTAAAGGDAINPMHRAAPAAHAMNFDLVNKYLAFVIRHLDVHNNHPLNTKDYQHYVDLIYGTCFQLESLKNNSGNDMQAIYKQLLEAECPKLLKVKILAPMYAWLQEQGKAEDLVYPDLTNFLEGQKQFVEQDIASLGRFKMPMTPNDFQYHIDNIFCTCEAIVSLTTDEEVKKQFMLDRYNQLLDVNCRAAIKVKLLWRFRHWLDERRVARAGYQYAKSSQEDWVFQKNIDETCEKPGRINAANGSYKYYGGQALFKCADTTIKAVDVNVFVYPAKTYAR